MSRLLLNAAGGDGNGNTDPPKPDANLTARLKQHRGDAGALAGQLFAENRHLQEQLAESRKKHAPEGAVVLTGDDAAAWAEFSALGTPADVKAALAERDTLKAETARHARDRALGAHGYDADALGPLLPADATIGEVEVRGADGKASKSLAITPAGADRPTPLAEYIDANLAKFKPVIGGPESREKPAPPRGAPPAPTARRDAPPPGEGGMRAPADRLRGIASDLKVNVGYGGF